MNRPQQLEEATTDLPNKGHPRYRRRVALAISVMFHVLLIAALGFWYVNRESPDERPAAAADTDNSPEKSQSTPAPQPAAPARPAAEPTPDVSSSQVNNSLERIKEHYDKTSDEEKLSVLEEKAGDLEDMASEESIDEIAGKFQQWSNIQPRASTPGDEPVEGEFDYATAQIHDIEKSNDDAGEVQFQSVLIDADGRTLEVQLTSEEGERAYRTFETLKKYPLAERVYRQIAMPLIDQAIAASSSKPAAGETESTGDDRDPFDGQLDESPAEVSDAEPSDDAETSPTSKDATPSDAPTD